MNRIARWGWLAGFCSALVACGGGSDAEPPPDSSLVFKVTTTDPAKKSSDAAVNAAISATFTRAPAAASVTRSSFTLDDGVGYRVGKVSVTGNTATFLPSAPLAYETSYTARLTRDVQDGLGQHLPADYTWKFKTGAAPDAMAPTVSSTSPADGALNVAVNAAVSVAFSETMDPASLNTDTFKLDQGATGVVSYAAGTATFTPSVPLAYDTVYTATVTRGAKDAAGNALEADHVWSFSTGPAPDLTAPTVASTYPAMRATGVAINTAISMTFSEAMDASTMTTAYVSMDQGVSGTVFYADGSLVFTPSLPLAYASTYTVTVDAGVKDAAGNPMGKNYRLRFTTGANPDQTAPTVVSSVPAEDARNVGTSTAIVVTFSEVLDAATVNTATFKVAGVSGTVSLQGQEATFIPRAPWAHDQTYEVTLTKGVKDVAGNALAAPYVFSFTTGKEITPLDFRVIDAEYSRSLDRIIMVGSSPKNQLHIYDPTTGGDTKVKLNLVPTSLSVSPNGKFAAVGHNGWISYVDLVAARLVKTLAVTADLSDVVLAGNGFVHGFPRTDQWVSVHSVRLSDGAETLAGGLTYAGTKGKLHPDGNRIYAADNGLSPSDIARYDIGGGPASYAYDSPYHGDYEMCGDLWMSEDGQRIFTRCGNVFRATQQQSDDMTYNGALPGVSLIQHLSHSPAAGRLLVIPGNAWWDDSQNADTVLRIHDDDFFTFKRSVPLPNFNVGGTEHAGHGRFVFFNRAGTRYFVVLQADPASALLNDFGVVRY